MGNSLAAVWAAAADIIPILNDNHCTEFELHCNPQYPQYNQHNNREAIILYYLYRPPVKDYFGKIRNILDLLVAPGCPSY